MSSYTRRMANAEQDSTIADTAASTVKTLETIDVTIGSGARVGPYYVGDAKCVCLAATGAAKFEVRGSGESGGLAASTFRAITIGGLCQTATATKTGFITEAVMPYEVYISDTSTASNPCTIYITY